MGRSQRILAAAGVLVLSACGSDDNAGGGSAETCGERVDGAGVLASFDPPCDPGKKGVLFTASGETLAYSGYAFPPAAGQEAVFVDGWQIEFERAIVTFDHITLSEEPDLSPTDQARTGKVVAELDGPWAVELHKGGPLLGKGGTDKAIAVAALTSKSDGSALSSTRRYAFGFEAIAATADAKNVNLDAEDLAAYEQMISAGHTILVEGTATWRGKECTSSDDSYDFAALPTRVRFAFGQAIPARYSNCQNPDNDPADPFDGEEHQRGVAIKANTSVTAQLTFHLDHLFWESTEHDSPAHFDQFAALHVGEPGTPTVTTADLVGVDFSAFEDNAGSKLPWRSCVDEYALPESKVMGFDSQGIPLRPGAEPADALRDFADYQAYNTSTLGHLNADGLCAVERAYPSPP
jgi:hypothetical protein